MEPAQILLAVITGVAITVSLVTDLLRRKILNLVTYPAILAGLVIQGIAWGWSSGLGRGLEWSLLGLVVAGLPFLVINAMNSRAFGMGDVKLMAAVGALMGFPFALQALLYVCLVGGAVAIVALLWKGRLVGTLGGMASRLVPGRRKGGDGASEDPPKTSAVYVPYGVAIAGGTLWAFLLQHRIL